MYKALYREYRPEVFDEMIGQQHIVKILKNQLRNDAVNHAYLFCGTRGTGKTTTARLLAKAVNCLSDGEKPCGECANCKAISEGNFIDLIEIDAASNNGINDIRELRESVNYPPAVGKKKVYIIDEVHMLSKEAFNGFLKTLEEPPENVIFILATTEPQKLPQTILSRCIRLDFRRVSEDELVLRMGKICTEKGIEIAEDALRLVATNADGSVRDGLTLLEQCIAGRQGAVTRDDVLESLGAVGEETYIDIVDDIINEDIASCIARIDSILCAGKDARQVLAGLIAHYRNLLLAKYVKTPQDVLNMSVENAQRLQEQGKRIVLAKINTAIILLSKISAEMAFSSQPRVLLELAVVQLAAGATEESLAQEDSAKPSNLDKGARTHTAGANMAKKVEPKKVEPKKDAEAKDLGIKIQENDIPKNEDSKIDDSQNDDSKNDMQLLWQETCEKLIEEQNMFVLLKKNTFPRAMSKGEIVIGARNSIAKNFLEEHREKITEALRSVAGTDIHLQIANQDETKQKSDERMYEADETKRTAKQIESMLGIPVDIK